MKDRLDVFQDLLERQNDMLDMPDIPEDEKVPAFDEGTQDFLEKVDLVYEQIHQIQDLLVELRQNQSVVLTDAFFNQALEDALESITKEIQELSSKTHKEIKAMQKELSLEASEIEDTTVRLKRAQASALLVLFKDVMNEYYASQTNHADQCKKRIKRQLVLIGKEKTDDELEEMIAEGNLQIDTQIQTEEAADILKKVQSRHDDILLLEKSLNELNAMFKDMYYLVRHQADMVDNIERNVQESAEVVQKAIPKLNTAYRYRRRKFYMCCPCLALCSIM